MPAWLNPTVANGHSLTGEFSATGAISSKWSGATASARARGAIRAIGFLLHSRSGTYADALRKSEQSGSVRM